MSTDPMTTATAEMFLRQRDAARTEVERLREQVAWTIERCNAAVGDGFHGNANSAVAAVCDELQRVREVMQLAAEKLRTFGNDEPRAVADALERAARGGKT